MASTSYALGYVPGPGEPSREQREEISKGRLAEHRRPADASYPASVDWRSRSGLNFVTPVKDQNPCGACVAFGVNATVESAYFVQLSQSIPNLSQQGGPPLTPIDLSEGFLYWCEGRVASCTVGWDITSAYAYVSSQGVPDEAKLPFAPGPDAAKCALVDDLAATAMVASAQTVGQGGNSQAMKTWISMSGPATSAMSVYADFYDYQPGTVYRYDGDSPFEGLHCVCVIGYDEGQEAWLCKNSWGTGWGDAGFFWIGYGECGIDSTMWGVTFVQASTDANMVPVYRLWLDAPGTHFYTVDPTEIARNCPAPHWVLEGHQFWAFRGAGSTPSLTQAVWRLSKGSEHIYSVDATEISQLVSQGWAREEIAFYLYKAPGGQNWPNTPVLRYATGGTSTGADQFLTTSQGEGNRSGLNYVATIGYAPLPGKLHFAF